MAIFNCYISSPEGIGTFLRIIELEDGKIYWFKPYI